MKLCKFGFHSWAYTHERESRWCTKCQKKQELDATGRWAESRLVITRPTDDEKYCHCPRDYTISIKTMTCQRCGLPRRPR
jgi:hypothetical protein